MYFNELTIAVYLHLVAIGEKLSGKVIDTEMLRV
jgi:hypothetical protein